MAKKHKLPVIEDACQAHLAEWRKSKVGTLGPTGCFSFQITKNLPLGDGGAILTNDSDWPERLYAFHNNCRPRNAAEPLLLPNTRAANVRMTEFVGTFWTTQMTRIVEQVRTRTENA